MRALVAGLLWGLLCACAMFQTHLDERPGYREPTINVVMCECAPAAGWSIRPYGQPQRIQIDDDLTDAQECFVLTHELLHAAGYVRHIPDPSCYFNSKAGDPPAVPCPAEVDKIRAVKGTFHVRILSPELHHAARHAVRVWNEAAGRTIFTLELL
jgi:hypothetical protein